MVKKAWLALGCIALGLVGAGVGVFGANAVLQRVPISGPWFNDLLRATAILVSAIAWPVVALVVATRHRAKLDDLFGRVRETFGGTKFDPPPRQEVEAPTDPLAAAKTLGAPDPTTGLPPDLAALRTTTVLETEKFFRDTLVPMAEPAVREQALITVVAALSVLIRFERVDALIWRSQINLLEDLNGKAPKGESPGFLRYRFYDVAAGVAKEQYERHSFEAYMDFLKNFHLTIDKTDGNIAITEFGREYLVWRAKEGRRHTGPL